MINATAPITGPGNPDSTLDVAVELLDPTGVPVAFSSTGSLSHTAAMTGEYKVRVLAEHNTAGEYVVSINGQTGNLLPFEVVATDPPDGASCRFAPTMTVDFNDGVRLSALSASALTIDAQPATGFSVVDGDTITFNLPAGLGDGLHTVHIWGIRDLQNTSIHEYTGHFTLDQTPPRVISSSIQEDGSVVGGSLTYVVRFSEPMLTANLDATDFSLQGSYLGVSYSPSSFSYDPAGTTLTIDYTSLPEDRYTLALLSADGQFEDVVGNNLDGEPLAWPIPPNVSGNGAEGGNFVVDFWMDGVDPRAFPTPLTRVSPDGSLIYNGSSSAVIGPASDTDSFTINLNAGQKLTALVVPALSLQSVLTITGPSGAGPITATAPGRQVFLQTLAVATAGTYTVTVGSANGTTGNYSLQLTLNAAVEGESHDGTANDTPLTAQSIDNSFISLGAARCAGRCWAFRTRRPGSSPPKSSPTTPPARPTRPPRTSLPIPGICITLGSKARSTPAPMPIGSTWARWTWGT